MKISQRIQFIVFYTTFSWWCDWKLNFSHKLFFCPERNNNYHRTSSREIIYGEHNEKRPTVGLWKVVTMVTTMLVVVVVMGLHPSYPDTRCLQSERPMIAVVINPWTWWFGYVCRGRQGRRWQRRWIGLIVQFSVLLRFCVWINFNISFTSLSYTADATRPLCIADDVIVFCGRLTSPAQPYTSLPCLHDSNLPLELALSRWLGINRSN